MWSLMVRRLKRKVSAKKLRAFAREEKSTARLYRRLGFKSQARQEARHAAFFKKMAGRS